MEIIVNPWLTRLVLIIIFIIWLIALIYFIINWNDILYNKDEVK